MTKFKLKRFPCNIFYFIVLIYLELVFRLIIGLKIFDISILYILLFSFFMALFFNVIGRLGSKKINKIIFIVILFILGFWYSVQLCVFKMFSFYFDWSLLGATEQVASFAGDGIKLILANIWGILLFVLPFILAVIFHKKIVLEKLDLSGIGFRIVGCMLVYGLFILSLNINKNADNSASKLYKNVNNISLNIKEFGVLHSFVIDTKRTILGFEEEIEFINPIASEEETPEEGGDTLVEYDYNNLDIDFDKLMEKENDSTIKSMHKYFQNDPGTKKNEYTDFFKGKNLILFMAESFNEIAVREDLTPTLYKLVNNGFVFENFYTPTISSTIGGEFQELTGLIAASGFLGPWKKGENSYPLGIGKVFKDMGYNTHAYHDHYYTFQSRNNYLKALGFDNYKGCYNGLENKINCKQWPESDVEMIKATIDDYINSEEPFFTYYVTVSGHGGYSWTASAMARKHKSEVEHLNYSLKPLSYLAAQIELNNALELLIEKLDEAGKLDDTVIALVGDHYPYYLSTDEVNEISTYTKDSVIEINHSNFILWNNKMEKVNVTKVGSQIDVLPTIYNLFGVPYDSRIIIGKDILSTEDGLAIFGNSSWVSDKGKYFASSKKFILNEGAEISDDYVSNMNKIVANKVAMSKYIMTKDYYRKVLK